MFRFIKVFIITFIVFFTLIIVITEGNITGTMIGATGQAALINTVLWCILKPKFTQKKDN